MTATVPATVRLANEIAVQFHHRDPDAAAAEIATHLRSFWEPRMLTALYAHVDAGGDGLDDLAVAAARRLRAGG
ncbi:formate dehydrogenase [Actinophytocola xinjiangensis]|uniref:Formate dehydrogenase n=1 Tax=Actinophytocola xinjiangensis TaxID=485602 RepID=A0A7Z1AUK8_9PSEU|nr:formate dehydrogenase subunit delta [Actinophytocola xinjiangensis]OLF05717.1 formate dehydrogenase [Actinophytocola xinjiangensis]